MLFRCSAVPCSGVPVFLVLLIATGGGVKREIETSSFFIFLDDVDIETDIKAVPAEIVPN